VALPGRARLRVEGLRGRSDVATRLTEHLGAHGAIQRVRASTITGNLLVLFDPRQLDLRALTGVIVRAEMGIPPGLAPGRPTREGAWHAMTVPAVLEQLATRPEKGLSSTEAAVRLAESGANGLPEPTPKTAVAIVAGHLTTLPVLLLGGAAMLSLLSGALIDAVVILAVVGINTTVGFITERRVERVLTSLRTAGAPPALVRRDGREHALPAAALVPGDVILLRAGSEVPADARLLDTDGLAVDEASLTGESVPVLKAAASACPGPVPLAERTNMVFAGTLVAEGSALAVITATGRHTELGRVRALVAESTAPQTPLERQLDHMGRQLVGISLGFCGLTFVLGLLRGMPAVELARMVISLAVAAVPEGLPAVATTTLALGMRRMMARGAIVRRLATVESLGATTVICADKTGTVTENRMSVHSWQLTDRSYRAPLAGIAIADQDLMRALAVGVLCNEADLANGGLEVQGSSTEGALLRVAVQAGLDYLALRRRYPLLAVRPRNDGDSWMATVHADGARWLIAVKGAPEQVLRYASRRLMAGLEQPITDDIRRDILESNAAIAARGMRVLGLAYKQVEAGAELSYDDLVWVALVALTDPVRTGVREAIAACRRAGIRTVLVTGDQAHTAAAIARELGLGHDGHVRVAEASALADLSGEELLGLAREVEVFARVSPAHKYRIVQALQAGGEVVAMTGDGINDAAALRAAVVGVAMGERGTDVARDVADVVLLKDDFSAIVDAIEQGRSIRDNVERSVRYLLATNFSEILVTLGALAVGGPRPLSAIQLLWINLLSDVFPALALAVEPPGPDVMARPPREPYATMLSRSALGGITRDATVLAASTLGARSLALAHHGPGAQAGTVGFCALTAAQLVHAFNCQASADAGVAGVHRSPRLAAVIGGSLALQVAAVAVPPLRALLGLTPLGPGDWGLVAASAALPLVAGPIAGLGHQPEHPKGAAAAGGR
jgi:Ca2+-transporting ATPase